MPRATNDTTQVTRFDLKTLEGAYVEIRKMSYGHYLRRQDMIMEMSMKGDSNQTEMVMDMKQTKVAEFDFANCIAGHNLEDDNGQLLDFRNAAHVHMLDPQVGQEVGSYIDKLNQFEADLKN